MFELIPPESRREFVDRLRDLRVARRLNVTAIEGRRTVVESTVVPVEAEEVEKRTQLGIAVLNHLFVHHNVNTQVQDISSPLERSEAKIVQFGGRFETQEIRHSVVELEVRRKAGKHDIARMSQRKDDFGIWEQPVDQR